MKKIGCLTIFLILIILCLFLLIFPRKEIINRTYPVKGIDVSHYQDVIDWKSIAESGISFVFVKATEGMTLKDKLLYGVHQRFWMQPNVLLFIWSGIGFYAIKKIMINKLL
jgi:hypothetical protein